MKISTKSECNLELKSLGNILGLVSWVLEVVSTRLHNPPNVNSARSAPGQFENTK